MANPSDAEPGYERGLRIMRILAQQADLRRALSNRPALTREVEINRAAAASNAEEQLVAYATECIAQGSHKLVNYRTGFAPEVQRHFTAVGKIVDDHIGPNDVDRRRALLQRAEEFTSCSARHRGHDETDEEIADSLNEHRAQAGLSRALLDRELGLRAILPEYSGGVDRDFTPAQARKLTDAFGHLQQMLCDQVRTRQPVMADQERVAVNWSAAGDAGRIARELETQLKDGVPDSTLERFEEQYKARQERARQAMRDDGFFASGSERERAHPLPDSSSLQPVAQPSRHRALKRSARAAGLTDDSMLGPPAFRRARPNRGSQVTAPSVLTDSVADVAIQEQGAVGPSSPRLRAPLLDRIRPEGRGE